MLRKLLGVAATCGLIVSLSVLVPERTRANAAQEKARPLSANEMKGTKGSGKNCNYATCDGNGACYAAIMGPYSFKDFGYPRWRYSEDLPWFIGTCLENGSGPCVQREIYSGTTCASYMWSNTSTTTFCANR